jgi:hypothetical protein
MAEQNQPGDSKVDAALAAGQLWRAKEILAGRVRACPFAPGLYEQFGQLLLKMGDDLLAGKFLFLSGVRRSEYTGPIALYLGRYSRSSWQGLLASFPTAVRRACWTDLPATVRADLRAAGVPEQPGAVAVWATLTKHPRRSPSNWLGCIGILFVLVVVALLISVVIVRMFY